MWALLGLLSQVRRDVIASCGTKSAKQSTSEFLYTFFFCSDWRGYFFLILYRLIISYFIIIWSLHSHIWIAVLRNELINFCLFVLKCAWRFTPTFDAFASIDLTAPIARHLRCINTPCRQLWCVQGDVHTVCEGFSKAYLVDYMFVAIFTPFTFWIEWSVALDNACTSSTVNIFLPYTLHRHSKVVHVSALISLLCRLFKGIPDAPSTVSFFDIQCMYIRPVSSGVYCVIYAYTCWYQYSVD